MRHADYVAFLSLCLVLQLLMPALKPARRLSAQTWLSQPGMTPVSSDAQRSAYVAGPRDHVLLSNLQLQHRVQKITWAFFANFSKT